MVKATLAKHRDVPMSRLCRVFYEARFMVNFTAFAELLLLFNGWTIIV